MSTAEEVKRAQIFAEIPKGRIIRFPPLGPQRLAFSPSMLQAAIKGDAKIDLVHQHGLWTFGSCVTRALHRKLNVPYVVTPHGSLEQWALLRSRWKKQIALIVYERSNIFGADCIHAVSEAEVRDIRNYGLTCPVAMIPNAVSDLWLDCQGNAESFRKRYDIPSDRRILLFLSRITPKKGLIILIGAIRAILREFSDWILVVAGIDEFGHRHKLEVLIEELDLKEKIVFTGPLFYQQKRDAFAAAELFILPSFSEGAPVVILESLGAHVPVITTKASPWKVLQEFDCGWWTDASPSGISETLKEAIRLPKEQLSAMGGRGRLLVERHYLWAISAQKTIELYEWILGRRAQPTFVSTI